MAIISHYRGGGSNVALLMLCVRLKTGDMPTRSSASCRVIAESIISYWTWRGSALETQARNRWSWSVNVMRRTWH